MDFRKNFTSSILPLFTDQYNTSLNFTQLPKECSDLTVVDYTFLDVFSIDPIGCTDADDAFSIYKHNEEVFLVIHIANPTEFIEINDLPFENATQLINSRYPILTNSIHLFDYEITQRCSLQPNEINNSTANPISIRYQIFPDGRITFIDVNISNVILSNRLTLSYEKAGHLARKMLNKDFNTLFSLLPVYPNKINTNNEISIVLGFGYFISDILINNRGGKINESMYHFRPDADYTEIEMDLNSLPTIKMKSMIEQFAILTNTELSIELSSHGFCSLFRNKEQHDRVAKYEQTCRGHDDLKVICYSHITSPLRRISDLIIHYDIKRYLLFKQTNVKIPSPWTTNIEEMLDRINTTTSYLNMLGKYMKKYLFIEWLHNNKSEVDFAYGFIRRNNILSFNITKLMIGGNLVNISPILLKFIDDPSINPVLRKNLCEEFPHETPTGDEIIVCLNMGEVKDFPCVTHTDLLSLCISDDNKVLPKLNTDLVELMRENQSAPKMTQMTTLQYIEHTFVVNEPHYDHNGNFTGWYPVTYTSFNQMGEPILIETQLPAFNQTEEPIMIQACDELGNLCWE